MIVFFLSLEYHVYDKYTLVMEYANCGNLRSYLKENFGELTWDDKYNMAYQIACAVSYLHNKGIVHRDLVICLYSSVIVEILNLHYSLNIFIFISILKIY
jgi:serine/threonine protein kinase